jgi:uncharacterized phage protein (TIGR02218 family)
MGNEQIGYTNQASNTTRGAIVYTPEAIMLEAISQNMGEAPPTINIVMSSSATVAQQFVPYQPIYPLSVIVFRHHREDPDNQYIAEFIGEVAAISFDEEEATVTFACRMISSTLDRRIPSPVYQKQCNYALYGNGCRVNKDLFKIETSVTSALNVTIVSGGFSSKPDQWLKNGYLVVDRSGESRFIVAHVGNTVTVQSPFVDLQASDTVTAYAGCDRMYATCVNKFSNNRWLGFAWVSTGKNPFVDNVFGTGTAGAPSLGSLLGGGKWGS